VVQVQVVEQADVHSDGDGQKMDQMLKLRKEEIGKQKFHGDQGKGIYKDFIEPIRTP
jgi:hypothetical protein